MVEGMAIKNPVALFPSHLVHRTCCLDDLATSVWLNNNFPMTLSQQGNRCPEGLLPTLAPKGDLSALVPVPSTGSCAAHLWPRDLLSAGQQPVPPGANQQTFLLK